MIISIAIVDGIQSGNFIECCRRWGGERNLLKRTGIYGNTAQCNNICSAFKSRRVVGSENRWMWQGIERMRESENSASSVNLAIKSHRSQLLWKSQWNYSRERQLLLHYQLPQSPSTPCHTYSHSPTPLAEQRSEMEQGSPVLWQPVPSVHKESATNKLLFRAQRMCQAWLNNCIRPKVEGYFSRF